MALVDTGLPPLIQALMHPACYGHPVRDIRLVETHISWVLLTGPFAYKIKKPVNLGFLDFSSLEKRRFFCEEELRLNRRLAPSLYLEVVSISGSPESPLLSGNGAAIEYAVKMVQFPEAARLDRMLARGELGPPHIDLLARELAEFHGRVAVAGNDQPFGDPDHVYEPVRQNFIQIRSRIEAGDETLLQRLESWSELNFNELRQTFEARKRGGFIRECHGDAHLANMVWLEERAMLFDCLEFSDNLRWIDVMSELAFLVMDLDDRGRPGLARRALNAYLEHTGDYAGLAVFRFYQVYRALVRAKVACIRLCQSGLSDTEKNRGRGEYRGYANLAGRYTQPPPPALIITHGLSGSGKTWLSQQLLEALGAVRVRSDIERKRLHGLAPGARSGSGIASGIYAPDASRRTYAHLAELAATILRAGHSVIVDAACLKREQRDSLRSVAQQGRMPCVILDIRTPETILRQRLRQRAAQQHEVSEAGLTVLDHQLATREPLADTEQCHVLSVDGAAPDMPYLERQLRERLVSI
ncbi:aminoglycoside phosphotransferase [Sulfuricaulis limicola]|uniref:Aminoglycoside phosphotransferase n=1 Tax=Sulfuricaulis limicola TaxID=1620215 RepID=A0A1B4XJ25_9GAMM|nr:bifunctional aminoglycoside phosphotransferase/ATP-binding protein [Sulfuricaulis limicola]BAV34805.1 aminoglycoside phosphotransferase [Sulfuricaulis limicola]